MNLAVPVPDFDRAMRPPAVWLRLFDIRDSDTLFSVRGFRSAAPAVQQRLEQVGASFVAGYRLGLYSGAAGPDPAGLLHVAPDFRGFAAEGAAMGCAVADFARLGGRRLQCWLAQTDNQYTYLTHVGVGWAIARLPFGRGRLLAMLDPVHSWLAIDGLGFHDTYFNHGRVLGGWRRERGGYAAHAWHQGVGRALWFVAGGDIDFAADAIARRFDPGFHGDMWAGLGLAITYAGGAGPGDLERARQAAGRLADHLGQGAVFAAAAHVRQGHVPGHTDAASAALAGCGAADAARLADRTRAEIAATDGQPVPAYEAWRTAIRAAVPGERVGA